MKTLSRLLWTIGFFALCIVGMFLCVGGASFPTTRGVYVNSNGVILQPTNFWAVNFTNGTAYLLPVTNPVAVNFVNTGNPIISEGTGQQSLQLGEGANAAGSFSISVGLVSEASEFGAVAVGTSSLATEWWAIALGLGATATDTNAMALGHSAVASHDNSVAIGNGAETSATNQIRLGASHRVTASRLEALDYIHSTNSITVMSRSNSPPEFIGVGGAQLWSDGTNLCVIIKNNETGGLTTNKVTISAWP